MKNKIGGRQWTLRAEEILPCAILGTRATGMPALN